MIFLTWSASPRLLRCYVRTDGMTSLVDDPGLKNILKLPVRRLYNARPRTRAYLGSHF